MKKMPSIFDFKHIAIVQTAFLGDIALALPLAQSIKDINPDVIISFITTPAGASIVALSPAVDNVIAYDKRGLESGWHGIRLMADLIKEKKIDCILALHRSLRTTLLSKLSGVDYTVSYNTSAMSFLYKKNIKYEKDLHEVERCLTMLKAFSEFQNGELPAAKVQIEIDESDSDFVEQKLTWLKLDNQEIVLIAPGSIWATKRWLPEHFAVLCGMLKNRGFIPVLTGSKSDSSLCAEIAGISGAANLCGQTTIPQTIYLMQKSRLLVTNDSAPTHFAYLAGCPALVIYGPTSPKFGFGPRGEKDKMIQLEGLKCSPCRIHGSDKCPIKTFDCMKKLLPERVFKMCMEMIG